MTVSPMKPKTKNRLSGVGGEPGDGDVEQAGEQPGQTAADRDRADAGRPHGVVKIEGVAHDIPHQPQRDEPLVIHEQDGE
ncbi:MAG TPA: hypothetical protein PKZ84_02420 [Anaerolineae bacterium]|nr:hypothetical protein [Anaerolineae bacterium]HQI83146.1 hypothetical protein [Anaerolineae bacterium]